MNRDFWVGFLSCSCILLLGLTQVNTKLDNYRQINEEFANLYNNVQPKQMKVFLTTPTYQQVIEREFVAISSSQKSIGLRLGTTMYWVQITSR